MGPCAIVRSFGTVTMHERMPHARSGRHEADACDRWRKNARGMPAAAQARQPMIACGTKREVLRVISVSSSRRPMPTASSAITQLPTSG